MLPDRVSNPGPLTYETGALPIALRGPAVFWKVPFTVVLFRPEIKSWQENHDSQTSFVRSYMRLVHV